MLHLLLAPIQRQLFPVVVQQVSTVLAQPQQVVAVVARLVPIAAATSLVTTFTS